jgi:hypothetical protein
MFVDLNEGKFYKGKCNDTNLIRNLNHVRHSVFTKRIGLLPFSLCR